MGWSIGYDEHWKRDIGYGVPALCDHPDCSTEIDRGLAYACGGEPYGGKHGCGLYFCDKHIFYGSDSPFQRCEACQLGNPPFTPKPDIPFWTKFKLADPSWAAWRAQNNHPEPTAEQIAEITKLEEDFLCK